MEASGQLHDLTQENIPGTHSIEAVWATEPAKVLLLAGNQIPIVHSTPNG
jgi:hypothetical protein